MADQPQNTISGNEMSSDADDDTLGYNFGPVFDEQGDSNGSTLFNPLSLWQPTDWLDLDSSVSRHTREQLVEPLD